MIRARRMYKYMGLLPATLITAPAFAGVPSLPLVTYGPLAPSAVPTIGGSLLLILAALMVAVVFRLHKAGNRSAAMLAGTLLAGALASGGAGLKMVADAHAVAGRKNLSDPSGGAVELTVGGNCLINTSGITQQIQSIETFDNSYTIRDPEGGSTCHDLVTEGAYREFCSDGPSTTLENNDGCFIYVLDER